MPKKSKAEKDNQVEDFLRKVEAVLRAAGGQCTFNSLGKLVVRPKGLGGSNKKALSRHPQRFKIHSAGVEHAARLPGARRVKQTKRVAGSSSSSIAVPTAPNAAPTSERHRPLQRGIGNFKGKTGGRRFRSRSKKAQNSQR